MNLHHSYIANTHSIQHLKSKLKALENKARDLKYKSEQTDS
jgi:hypothetical protein